MSAVNVLPVMHGSMFIEVDTIALCEKTQCRDCAYQLHKINPNLSMSMVNCEHLATMLRVGVR